jgi:predicted outer membrane repeat protein
MSDDLRETGPVSLRMNIVTVLIASATLIGAPLAVADGPDARAPANASIADTAGIDTAGINTAAVATVQAVRVSPPPAGPTASPLPADAQPVDTSHPDIVIGTGTAASCTSQEVIDAVAHGGIITFSCGPDPVTIVMSATAKVFNTSSVVVLDGGGRVTLSGAGQRRILYMNTCDQQQIWTTSHCQDQEQPQLTIQGLTFTQGNSTGDLIDGGGGGAVFVRGGRLKVVASTFTDNRCESTGPDLGGGALRVLSQSHGLAVVIASSTFGGGPDAGNSCSNGAAISSIGVSWRIYTSTFTDNSAIGNGANPSRSGTPGGGSGGAIYLDGNQFTLDVTDSVFRGNSANEGGGAIFFVSNDRTGELRITNSVLENNPSRGFETAGFPGIFFLGAGTPQVTVP